MACVCPEYVRARTSLLSQLPLGYTLNSVTDLCKLLSSGDASKMSAVGTFLVRARQTRRRLKNTLEQLNEKFNAQCFASERAAWRLKGKPCCRHGVLFTEFPPAGCKCMNTDSADSDWANAKYMPALSAHLKCVVAVRFDRHSFKRLALIQAEARALHW